jgi:putative tricarboxylic transport membrane protein
MFKSLKRSVLAASLLVASPLALANLHFLVPGGPGGGWDTTARGVGEAMVKAGIEDNASFQNMSGGGGGRAIAYLIESGTKKGDMLMVNSTPIVLRALSGKIPYSYRDLTPVASMIADYGAFVVRNDSPFKT